MVSAMRQSDQGVVSGGSESFLGSVINRYPASRMVKRWTGLVVSGSIIFLNRAMT